MIEELNGWTVSTTYTIATKVVETVNDCIIEAVRDWAIDNGVDEVLLMSEEKLKEILKLGAVEYRRIYGD